MSEIGLAPSRPRLLGLRPSRAAVAATTLAAFAIAELVTTYVHAVTGVALHALILSALIAVSGLLGDEEEGQGTSRFLYALTLVPLIRILSLAQPLGRFEEAYWYLVAGFPVLVAALVVIFALQLRPSDIGLRLGRPALHLPVAALGFGLGVTEYLILEPDPLIDGLTLRQFVLPALVLLAATGFLEEMVFRGVLQYVGEQFLGLSALLYVSAVFAILHIGYRSAVDIAFVFAIALVYAWAARRTGSIMGVGMSHGITNIMLFLVVPFVPAISGLPTLA